MPLTPGTRLGSYEVTGPIGAGGMGEVYRATDTNLKRAVAIKVLPAAVAEDPDRLARFQREAEVLASLNHSNIAAIYGFEKTADCTALIMELVEGEDLSRRIGRGAIPPAEAVPLARQIAEALEAAHEQGIMHRDLKPANIRVRPDGTIKVLDFGLARAVAPATAVATTDFMDSPTLTSPAMTEMGVILGTAAYMAPEQARGRAVDRRADVWAFGAVLFEMLSGRSAFTEATLADTLAAIVARDPDWTALPAATPSSVHHLLRRCLEKDLTRRLQAIGEARIVLQDRLATEADTPARTAPSRLWRTLPWAVTGAALAAGLWALGTRAPGDVAAAPPLHVDIMFPPPCRAAHLDRERDRAGAGRPLRGDHRDDEHVPVVVGTASGW